MTERKKAHTDVVWALVSGAEALFIFFPLHKLMASQRCQGTTHLHLCRWWSSRAVELVQVFPGKESTRSQSWSKSNGGVLQPSYQLLP